MFDLPPESFYRGYDPESKLESVARHVQAMAIRAFFTFLYCFVDLAPETWNEIKSIATIEALWGLCICLAAMLVAGLVGGPVAVAVDLVLIGLGVWELWPVVKNMSDKLWQGLRDSYYANNADDLAKAGNSLASGVASGLVVAFQLIFTHKVFKTVSPQVNKRFPAPEWAKREYGKIERLRKAKEEVAAKSAELAKTAARTLVGPAGRKTEELAPPIALGLGIGAVTVASVAAGVLLLTRRKD